MATADADDDTTTTAPPPPPAASSPVAGVDPDVLSKMIQQIMGPQGQATPPQQAAPSSHEGRTALSLLGEALGGGESYGSTTEREQGGISALAAMGARMLVGADWSPQRHTFGSIAGQGLEAAQQSLAGSQAVSAARQGAAQQYQQQQQQNQLERLKAALPLLELQQKYRAIGAMPATLGGTGTAPGNTSLGAVGATDVPPELLPVYQAASARTGIPVDVLVAQGRQESGFDNTKTGGAGEIGIGQILPSTAASPGFGLSPVDPKALRDPATNINFQADYLRAHMPKDADPTDPKAIAAALQGYNGGGDPDYVNHVLRFRPGAAASIAKLTAPPPGAPGAPAAPAPVGTTPPNARVQIPPPAATPPVVGARPTLPPPEPSTGGQAAGPAAPTSGVIPPSPPGSDAAVAAIRSGMIGAGANPTTLAPGQGSAPAPQPGAVVVAGGPGGAGAASGAVGAGGAGGPPAAPPAAPALPLPGGMTLKDFIAANRADPTPAQRALWSQDSQKLIADMAGQAARAQQEYASAHAALNPEGMAKAQSDYNTITAKMAAVQQDVAKAAADRESQFYTSQNTDLTGTYKDAQQKLLQAQLDQAKTQQEQENARQVAATAAQVESDKMEHQARLTAQQNLDTLHNTATQKNLELMDTQASDANNGLQQLRLLKQLSDSAGPSTLLPPSAKEWLVNAGLATQSETDRWGAQSALDAAQARMIPLLRAGAGFQRMTNADLNLLERTSPGASQTPQDFRDARSAFLMTSLQRSQDFAVLTRNGLAAGKDLPTAQAEAEAKLGPIIPTVPNAASIPPEYGNDALATTRWLYRNVPKGTFVRDPRGNLKIFNPDPNQAPPPDPN